MLEGDDFGGQAFALFLRPHLGAFRQLMCPYPGEFAHFSKNAYAGGLAWGVGEWALLELTDALPSEYVFALRACYEAECNHPICQRGRPTDKLVWYTAGPRVQYWRTQCSVTALIYQSQIQSDLGDVRNVRIAMDFPRGTLCVWKRF